MKENDFLEESVEVAIMTSSSGGVVGGGELKDSEVNIRCVGGMRGLP